MSVARISTEIEMSQDLLLALTGPNESHLKLLENAFRIRASLRGLSIHLSGTAEDVALAERTISDLLEMINQGSDLTSNEVKRVAGNMKRKPEAKPSRGGPRGSVKLGNGRKAIIPKGQVQQEYIANIQTHDVTFGIGPAGTGKSYLAVAAACSALLNNQVKKIVLTRPAVEAGEKLGFLPGGLQEKVDPYLRPLYDALGEMVEREKFEQMVQGGIIEVAPLAFMRGRTITNSFIILDEAQNTTADQMKMFLTRLGPGSKAVITGDVTQIDLPHNQRSGLADALGLLKNVEGISFNFFSDADVVRHPMVQRIVRAYEARADAVAAKRHAQETRDFGVNET
jgi:phosphate starvation-inducible PhoH-like protein